MAGVALAGTVSSLGSPSSPTIGQAIPTATTTTTQQEDRAAEARGRANEAGEDLRGPCDEAEHANDPRCTGVATAPAVHDDDAADDRGDDNSGPGSSNSGEDDGGHSGHGRGGDD